MLEFEHSHHHSRTMHTNNFTRSLRTILLTTFLASLMGACHQSEDQTVAPQPEPSKFQQREALPEHPPMVQGTLGELPELLIEAKAEKIRKTPEMEQLAGVALPEKRKQLRDVTAENQTLAEKIRLLESQLQHKEIISQQITRKIENVKNQMNP